MASIKPSHVEFRDRCRAVRSLVCAVVSAVCAALAVACLVQPANGVAMTFDTSVLRKPWPPLNRRNGHAPLDHDIGELIQRLPIRCPPAGKMKISGDAAGVRAQPMDRAGIRCQSFWSDAQSILIGWN